MADETSTTETPAQRPRSWRRGVLRAVIYYVVFVAALTLFQRSLIYHPKTEASLPAERVGLQAGSVVDIEFPADDETRLHGWHFVRIGHGCPDGADCDAQLQSAPAVVLYFPGNAGNREYRVTPCLMLTGCKADVLIADYRGYGDNPGSPSEDQLIADAHALWRYATETRGVAPEKIVIYGESLGGGVAVRLAGELCDAGHPPAGLIVQSSFNSLAAVASRKLPIVPANWLLWDRYASDEHIQRVTCPYLHLHGENDSVVPVDCGEALFAAAPACAANGVEKCFVRLAETDHNDVLQVAYEPCQLAIVDFFQRIAGAD